MPNKSKQTISKRFTVTKKGKVMHRHAGQDHFNSRDTGKITMKKRRDHAMELTHVTTIKKLIS
jgi:ribosomal protein L35